MCGDVRSDRWRRGGRACPCAQTDRPGGAEAAADRAPWQHEFGALSARDDAAGFGRREPGAGDRPAGAGRRGHCPGRDPPLQRDRPDPRWAGGRPRLLSPDDEDFVVQTATTRPTKLGQPFTRWSLRKLAACLRKVHGRVIRIGRETLRGLLARRGVTFQRTKTWKESRDPEREAKLDRIEEVHDRFPDRVFAFDEFGPLGIRPTAGSCWAEQGRPERHPATYHRTHGVRYFHGLLLSRRRPAVGREPAQEGAVNTLAALKSIRAARPDGAPVYVTLDNLSAHKGADIRRWVKRHKVELCFTPTYASWANPIEAQFGPLRQFTIANSNHPNHTLQTRALHAYLRWRNANARHRDVLAAERKERAPIRSEKVIRWGGRPLKAVA